MNKTHKYFSKEKHREICPKITKSAYSMVCEDCLITKEIKGDIVGYVKIICDIDKLKEE